MEYFVMMATHLIKTVHYFTVDGFPEITLDMLPDVIQALIFNTAKLLTIYAAIL